jgi:hypothetical protein
MRSARVGQGLLPGRSRERLASKIRCGEALLLLDALDEVTPARDGTLRALLRGWADQADEQARCVITSRIGGYTGSPVPSSHEVELQVFTADNVAAVISAWNLPMPTATRLRSRTEDLATGAMARIPLMLAWMC